jgi:coenzyme Q-binding protein COQ10
MYSIVADVDRYREFLPWCLDSRVLSRSSIPLQNGKTVMRAELQVGFGSFQERYTSLVHCIARQNQYTVKVRSIL